MTTSQPAPSASATASVNTDANPNAATAAAKTGSASAQAAGPESKSSQTETKPLSIADRRELKQITRALIDEWKPEGFFEIEEVIKIALGEFWERRGRRLKHPGSLDELEAIRERKQRLGLTAAPRSRSQPVSRSRSSTWGRVRLDP